MVGAAADVAPLSTEAFLIADDQLNVCSVSRSAEALLDVPATRVINRPLTELLILADADGQAGRDLAALVSWAARADVDPQTRIVRPTRMFGVRLQARVAHCGPPGGALVTLSA
jgi:PAS domain-containing protein